MLYTYRWQERIRIRLPRGLNKRVLGAGTLWFRSFPIALCKFLFGGSLEFILLTPTLIQSNAVQGRGHGQHVRRYASSREQNHEIHRQAGRLWYREELVKGSNPNPHPNLHPKPNPVWFMFVLVCVRDMLFVEVCGCQDFDLLNGTDPLGPASFKRSNSCHTLTSTNYMTLTLTLCCVFVIVFTCFVFDIYSYLFLRLNLSPLRLMFIS
jgi:hypothetical protein